MLIILKGSRLAVHMTRGGYRENAKRPLKYGEPTEVVRFSVPKSKVEFIKKLVRKALKAFEIRKPKH